MSNPMIIGEVNYGPLAALIGTWKGDEGLDIAPEPDDDEHNPFYETIVFTAAGDVTNAEQQTSAIVQYTQIVSRKSNDKVFHQQVGYWLWDEANSTLTETFTIPRAVAVVASGVLAAPEDLADELVFEVSTAASDSIAQPTFMLANAKTTGFSHVMTVKGDRLSYSQTTLLDIYGKTNYGHTDNNVLQRVT